jgi:hypothetical protein
MADATRRPGIIIGLVTAGNVVAGLVMQRRDRRARSGLPGPVAR